MSENKSKTTRAFTRDLESAIYRPKKEDEIDLAQPGDPATRGSGLGDPVEKKVCVYTIMGDHDFLDAADNPTLMGDDAEGQLNAYAKTVVVNDGNPKYFVKRNSGGDFFNPIGMMSDMGKDVFGSPKWSFKEINKKAFNQYLDFLKTRNNARLKNAEREMR